MTIRSRPVLDRKHRPRWQDELRTQQLTVLGFALAIALALGMFGAAAWNGYWETRLRPVATVGETTFVRGDLATREGIITAEILAQVTELQSRLDGGPRDAAIQAQVDSLSQAFGAVTAQAAESLVRGAIMAQRAPELGLSVGDDEVEAEIADRMSLDELVRGRLLLVEFPEDGEEGEGTGEDAEEGDAGDEADGAAVPTEEQIAATRAEAEAALERIEGGEEFSAVATDVSDDPTASSGGLIGWFGAEDSTYGDYFDPLADAEVDEVVGPIETDDGFVLLQLLDRREATATGPLDDLLADQGVSDEAYRAYVRDELLAEAFTEHFLDEVVGTEAPQRRVARIGITASQSEEPTREERARHVLIEPEAEEDEEPTDEAWEAARQEALEVREQLLEPDADWFAIAAEHSDDTGSASRGGDLGWYDPEASGFVEEFSEALAELEVGEVSEPVRSEFGWHVIQKTGERESPAELAERLVAELDGDLDAFADAARRLSDDRGTAVDGGELGWIVRYQLETMHEEAIFGLGEVGEVSQPVEDDDGIITIYQLLESSEAREVDDAQRSALQRSGFERWFDAEVRSAVDVWLDPQYELATGS